MLSFIQELEPLSLLLFWKSYCHCDPLWASLWKSTQSKPCTGYFQHCLYILKYGNMLPTTLPVSSMQDIYISRIISSGDNSCSYCYWSYPILHFQLWIMTCPIDREFKSHRGCAVSSALYCLMTRQCCHMKFFCQQLLSCSSLIIWDC